MFPEGPVIKCFVIPPTSKIEKAPKKIICWRPLHKLAALEKLSGCQNQPVQWKSHDNSLFLRSLQKIQTVLKLLWLLLTLNSSILSLIFDGTAYFVVNYKHFPTWRPRSSSELTNVCNPFLAPNHKLVDTKRSYFPFCQSA